VTASCVSRGDAVGRGGRADKTSVEQAIPRNSSRRALHSASCTLELDASPASPPHPAMPPPGAIPSARNSIFLRYDFSAPACSPAIPPSPPSPGAPTPSCPSARTLLGEMVLEMSCQGEAIQGKGSALSSLFLSPLRRWQLVAAAPPAAVHGGDRLTTCGGDGAANSEPRMRSSGLPEGCGMVGSASL